MDVLVLNKVLASAKVRQPVFTELIGQAFVLPMFVAVFRSVLRQCNMSS